MIEEQMNEMAEAFLRWPLPDDVCADDIACKAGAPHRTGTNLLTAHQALAMIRFVCRPELTAMHADVERLSAELAALRDKALQFDLDQAGIARRDADAAELVELRAELAALRAERDALLAAVEAAPHAHFCLGDKFRMADGTRVNMCNCWKRPALGER